MSSPHHATSSPESTNPYTDVLDDLVRRGQDLARQIHEAAGHDLPLEAAAAAFDRVARAVRRTILLATRLRTAAADTGRDHAAARRQLIRAVEDRITRDAPGPDTSDALHAELRERLEGPELEDEFAHRPTEDIINDILRDLGLAKAPGQPTVWTRRTPADIRHLHARAAAAPPSFRKGGSRATPPGSPPGAPRPPTPA